MRWEEVCEARKSGTFAFKIYFSLKSGPRICRTQGVCCVCMQFRPNSQGVESGVSKKRVAKGQRHIAHTFPVF